MEPVFIGKCPPITAANTFFSMPNIIPAPLDGEITLYAARIIPPSINELNQERYLRLCEKHEVVPHSEILLNYDAGRRLIDLYSSGARPHIIQASFRGEEEFRALRDAFSEEGKPDELVYGRFHLPAKQATLTDADRVLVQFWQPLYRPILGREPLPAKEGFFVDATGCADLPLLSNLESIIGAARTFSGPLDFRIPNPNISRLDDYRDD